MNPSSTPSSEASTLDEAECALSPDLASGSDPAYSPVPPSVGMPSEHDQHLHDVGVAALAAISQDVHPVNQQSGSSLVSEVVNAVTEGSSRNSPLNTSGTVEPSSIFSTPRLYPTGVESNDLSPAPEVNSAGSQTPTGNANMHAVVQELIGRTAAWPSAVIVEDIENNSPRNEMVMDYEPATVEETYDSPSSLSDDDLEDFIRFYPDEEYYYRSQRAHRPPLATGDIDLDDFYRRINYDTTLPSGLPSVITQTVPDIPDIDEPLPTAPGVHPPSIIHTTTYERNLTIDEFIERWMIQTLIPRGFSSGIGMPPQLRPLSKMISWKPPQEIHRPHKYRNDTYDLQQIPWMEILKVKRADARSLRDAWYTSYHNLDYSPFSNARRPPQHESYFREKAMYTSHKASIEHFQLRNLMSVPAYNTVHFASQSKVFSWTPAHDEARCLIDLTKPEPDFGLLGPVKISTMKTAHGLTIAGGFCGEYALRAAGSEGSGAKGLVTPDFNDGITNHVDIIGSRSGRSPIGIFASNDQHLRVLDCETNVFLSDQELSRPINCTATSPDSRLRVVIGDSPDAWVIEADTGRPVHPLRGHRDFGFACAWSPDMRHIATSNQDKTVIIWDARTWRILETIDSDVAGYRSLRFSPVGGGSRTLLCCEPADRISIIDAHMFQTRQVHDFFGEIGGADYTPDGGAIWVANTDSHYGGLMEFQRTQWGRRFGVTDLPDEWVREADLDGDGRSVLRARERQLRFLRNLSDEEHEALIL
ncbi:hypothetical protein N7474_004408 [Penicillium riverlandense]|uniref:uncharacterized protein n=1 Tax=Penicillium riverlandense TaxID=1903569 RepID=UPI00254706CA|nr:uncharacterized protein N7474_004408 [Penicillium riverlandense]KAJ5818817.1 hypothetical protein N7474_004408 [Penicillium riverlandense]